MSLDLAAKLGAWILAGAFQAGVLYMAFRGMRRDLNGIGSKLRGLQEANEQRYLTFVLVTMLGGIPEAERPFYLALAQMFLAAGKGRNT
jgi:hypothetical protein